jgi:UDP-N-acetylmuramate dehydrogenase
MIEIKKDISLAPLTSFKIGGPARAYCAVRSAGELHEALEYEGAVFMLGGGSNILVSDRGWDGLVIHLCNRGIEIADEDDASVRLRCAAGENWDDVAAYAVEHGWWGIENLSHIPGSAGAFPVQNVGAYGQEASQTVEEVTAFDREKGSEVVLGKGECGFAYRRSIFNSDEKGRFVIMEVALRLSKIPRPNLEYPDVKKYFENASAPPSIREIREAIIEIRGKKFPFPVDAATGSAGSFIKNLTVSPSKLEDLESRVLQEFGVEAVERLRAATRPTDAGIKVPTALLLDLCGVKGREKGGAVINPAQPLVIRNSGSATAEDVLELFRSVRREVYARLRVVVENEPELVGFSPQEIEYYFSLV